MDPWWGLVFAGLWLRNVCYFYLHDGGASRWFGSFFFQIWAKFLQLVPFLVGRMLRRGLGGNERACSVWDLHLFVVLLVFFLFGQYPGCLGDHCAFLLKGGEWDSRGAARKGACILCMGGGVCKLVSWAMRVMPKDGLESRKGKGVTVHQVKESHALIPPWNSYLFPTLSLHQCSGLGLVVIFCSGSHETSGRPA